MEDFICNKVQNDEVVMLLNEVFLNIVYISSDIFLLFPVMLKKVKHVL